MADDELTDADLVARVLEGDGEAFGSLYDRYARLVRAVVCGVSRDWPAIHDLTQECFLRAYRNLARLRQPDRFGPWIVGIARQVARERRRSLRRDRHRFIGSDMPERWAAPNAGDSIDEDTELVMRRIAELPERERLAIHAFFLNESNAGAAAELLDLSRSGFYAVLGRGLSRLSKFFERPTAGKEKK